LDKTDFISFIREYQDRLCKILETEDGVAKFKEDRWERADGGGGITRIMQGGKVFEKAGVNTSVVHGPITPALAQQLQTSGKEFFACGVSIVIHPLNPMVPTAHANFRYFQTDNDRWFGGGGDLTPYYFFEEDRDQFHNAFKNACGVHHHDFKKNCDEYFVNKHRGERRGVGGIFYDYIRPDDKLDADYWFEFSKANAEAFINGYLPIVQRRKNEPYTEQNTRWQEIRRGRYVEFNLIHDRGTLFGLRSGGRTESILMSLPPRARFEYDDRPEPGSREAALLEILKT